MHHHCTRTKKSKLPVLGVHAEIVLHFALFATKRCTKWYTMQALLIMLLQHNGALVKAVAHSGQ